MSDFSRYIELFTAGATPVEAYRAAKANGMGEIDAIRMLRTVFGLSLGDAKEVTIVATGTAASLKEHEEQIARELSKSQK